MRSKAVCVDHELRIDGNDIGEEIADEILAALTIPNQEHLNAKSRKLYKWWEIPEHHIMFRVEDDHIIVMPRGFALELKRILRRHGMKVDWIQRTQWRTGKPYGPQEFSYREHQPAAVAAIRRHRQGIYKAPTGSGKTVTVCGLLNELQPRFALILVDRINLVDQWKDRIQQYLDPPFMIGMMGDGRQTVHRITVATIQSIYKQKQELGDHFFDMWDLVCLDECHHVTAQMYREVMSEFSARYRFGVSATPDKTGEFELAKLVLGPVFYEDDYRDIVPEVKVLYTDFDFHYWGDHKADKKGECEVPGCKNPKPFHNHRNNYGNLLKALVEDESRNGLVMEICKQQADHTVLVCTDQTKHIDQMVSLIKQDGWLPLDDIYVLTGVQKRHERAKILDTVERRGHGIILSTIAHEALDLPVIDRIVLPFPTKNAKKTNQQIGRGTRSAGGKTDCIVFDIADEVGPLQSQLRARMRGCYQPLGLKVEMINKPDKAKKGLGRVGSL